MAAFSQIVAKEVLLGEGSAAKILAAHGDAFRSAQKKIAADGPGKDLLYRAMNGFNRKDRAANKNAEQITET
ncbi:hypothetical protein [Rhizobium sullae]|uniref:hypothetical protein n=1 Tax=Rhizobium sullae TaxID=50338 RepID=UPI000B35AA23|nr:hypothetical protein [Rhizobium sullae]